MQPERDSSAAQMQASLKYLECPLDSVWQEHSEDGQQELSSHPRFQSSYRNEELGFGRSWSLMDNCRPPITKIARLILIRGYRCWKNGSLRSSLAHDSSAHIRRTHLSVSTKVLAHPHLLTRSRRILRESLPLAAFHSAASASLDSVRSVRIPRALSATPWFLDGL